MRKARSPPTPPPPNDPPTPPPSPAAPPPPPPPRPPPPSPHPSAPPPCVGYEIACRECYHNFVRLTNNGVCAPRTHRTTQPPPHLSHACVRVCVCVLASQATTVEVARPRATANTASTPATAPYDAAPAHPSDTNGRIARTQRGALHPTRPTPRPLRPPTNVACRKPPPQTPQARLSPPHRHRWPRRSGTPTTRTTLGPRRHPSTRASARFGPLCR